MKHQSSYEVLKNAALNDVHSRLWTDISLLKKVKQNHNWAVSSDKLIIKILKENQPVMSVDMNQWEQKVNKIRN